MVMINGGSPINVYWQVGTSATIGVANPSYFLGNIIAEDSVSIGSGVIQGTVVALTGALTIADPTCIGSCLFFFIQNIDLICLYFFLVAQNSTDGLATSAPVSVCPITPTLTPSAFPSHSPSLPTHLPTQLPTIRPSRLPTQLPTVRPSRLPTGLPTFRPSQPTLIPTLNPTHQPAVYPPFTNLVGPNVCLTQAVPGTVIPSDCLPTPSTNAAGCKVINALWRTKFNYCCPGNGFPLSVHKNVDIQSPEAYAPWPSCWAKLNLVPADSVGAGCAVASKTGGCQIFYECSSLTCRKSCNAHLPLCEWEKLSCVEQQPVLRQMLQCYTNTTKG